MPSALRWLFLGIVLLNLAFVQLTGTVSSQWLLGLWLLAAASPLLQRFHERPAYVATWNAAIVAGFLFLLHDAATSGLLHMLEDGLLLSALCQVHLLNNLGRRQRPDLLFFNSFLVAFVTSFFCADLSWSLAFFAYAGLLTMALQLHVSAPRTPECSRADVLAVLRDGAPRGAMALLLTGVVFVAWPRDFKREGWIGESWQLGGKPTVAFAEQIRLDRTAAPTLSDEPVLRITPHGGRETAPQHWRGATFVQFDGIGWQPFRIRDFGSRAATDTPWAGVSRSQWRRGDDDGGAAFVVQPLDARADRLFLPLECTAVDLPDRGGLLLDPKADAVMAVVRLDEGLAPTTSPLAFEARLARSGRSPQPGQLTQNTRALLQQLPERLPAPLHAILDELRRKTPAQADDQQRAQAAADWLAERRRYALPGSPGAARGLDEFLLGAGGGHCELFATALALLLRMQAIPCRVVGGYLATEWDAERRSILVRERHAHAWVEAWLPGLGWTTLDATPEASTAAAAAAPWWGPMAQLLEDAWAKVTDFGDKDRARIFAWIQELPSALVHAPVRRPTETFAFALLVGLFVLHRRLRRRAGSPPSLRRLRRAMRRCGVAPQPGETLHEMMARVAGHGMRGDRAAQLAAAVADHERERYAR